MEYAWNRYGIGMEYVWNRVLNRYGLDMEYVWNRQRICMESVRNRYGIGMEYIWIMYGTGRGTLPAMNPSLVSRPEMALR